jgi:hypothetical protein
MSTDHVSQPQGPKSLAQVLFEASPNVGWEGPWARLSEEQRRWWEHFATIARTHVLANLHHETKLLTDHDIIAQVNGPGS